MGLEPRSQILGMHILLQQELLEELEELEEQAEEVLEPMMHGTFFKKTVAMEYATVSMSTSSGPSWMC